MTSLTLGQLTQTLQLYSNKTIMLKKEQQDLYDAFYESTHKNEYIDQKTEILVGLSAAIAMNCIPCTHYY